MMLTKNIAVRVALVGFHCGGTSISGFAIGSSFSLRRSAANRHKMMGAKLAAAPHAPTTEDDAQIEVPVVCTGSVDYSAADEYIRAHYNRSNYFDNVASDGDSASVEHAFYNGRVLQSHCDDERAMLDENGLAIIESPIVVDINWSDVNDIKQRYLPELEKLIPILFPSSKLLGYSFWNSMVRGESYEISREGGDRGKTPTANIASLVHIDTDVGAYKSIEEFLGIVEKNSVRSSCDFKDMADHIVRGRKRFAVVNFWRNIGDAPVTSAPLAILSTRYDDGYASAFPDARPDMKESKWYIFPNATRDEAIVFYQYDRSLAQPSDLWHCAISTQGKDIDKQIPPRKSFDVRILVVLDECVPEELDRFNSDRTRPVLTLEQSGCFCDEQSAKRTGK